MNFEFIFIISPLVLDDSHSAFGGQDGSWDVEMQSVLFYPTQCHEMTLLSMSVNDLGLEWKDFLVICNRLDLNLPGYNMDETITQEKKRNIELVALNLDPHLETVLIF